ncbi:MAG: DUF354 domain-containing protein, partial [Candidatus Cloacimonadaceae bacterium]|nr:DUF354 domain-containing protein [Candidatus Cloacimonadaceae bacterium]
GIIHLLQADFRVFKYCILHKVDILLGSDISITHVAFILGKKSLAFTDDDYYFIGPYSKLAFPYATFVIAPEVVNLGKWTKKKIAYPGTQKTAYLHPRYYHPNPEIKKKYGLCNKRYILVRRVEFTALHDSMHIALTGITDFVLDELIKLLSHTHQIIISYEGNAVEKYQEYIMKIDPEDMIDLIFYADLLVGDSQSMQVEAALLGTPSIRSNKWVLQGDKISVIHYLETKYNLCVGIPPAEEGRIIATAKELVEPGNKEIWAERLAKFYAENISLTDLLFWLISNLSVNCSELHAHPDRMADFLFRQLHVGSDKL